MKYETILSFGIDNGTKEGEFSSVEELTTTCDYDCEIDACWGADADGRRGVLSHQVWVSNIRVFDGQDNDITALVDCDGQLEYAEAILEEQIIGEEL